MADKNAPVPKARAAREARLKAALKANLGRRKAQASARTARGNAADDPKEQKDG